jgi:sulfate/thiosulfate transport system substrate-binding protein
MHRRESNNHGASRPGVQGGAFKMGIYRWIGRAVTIALLVSVAGCGASTKSSNSLTLTNVSYDPTRELYVDFNKEFASHWLKETGQSIDFRPSHGGSGAQARSVIDGLKADVVTLAIAYDIDQIAQIAKLLPADWQTRLPNNSSPYQSTVVFLVRKGNPKQIKDWDDLVKPDVKVITSNPKTSGAGRLAYLAGWGYSLKKNNNDEAKAKDYITALYKNVPVLDSGARGSTTTFVQRGIGDVLLAWENEALLAIKELGAEKVEMVVPSMSILAEPPVAVVDKNAESNGTAKVAKAYLEYLYSPTGQKIAAKHYYRPSVPESVDFETMKQFPKLELFTVKDVFGSWQQAHDKHFKEGAIFDSIYVPSK